MNSRMGRWEQRLVRDGDDVTRIRDREGWSVLY